MRWFVSRHPGALVWLAEQGITVDVQVAHLHACQVAPGDVVIGTLPVQLAAEVCACGAEYWHLQLAELPLTARGQELSAAQMRDYGARLVRFEVRELAQGL